MLCLCASERRRCLGLNTSFRGRVEPVPGPRRIIAVCGDIVTLAELGAMGRDSCERSGRNLSKQFVTAHNGLPGKPSCIIWPTMGLECLSFRTIRISWGRNSTQRDMRSTIG